MIDLPASLTVNATGLEPGLWTFAVKAYRGSVLVGEGNAPVMVTSGGDAPLAIVVGPAASSPPGDLRIDFAWSDVLPHEAFTFSYRLETVTGTEIWPWLDVPMAIPDNTHSTTGSVTAGTYRVVARLSNAGGVTVWGDSDIVLVGANSALTTKSWTVGWNDLNKPAPPRESSIPLNSLDEAWIFAGCTLKLDNPWPGAVTKYLVSDDGSRSAIPT
ncbi:MAG: hypothetical protein MZV49_08930 [Rhodopseudomonas palustris]|nr:hypothetical protein [Rhodopseudomonas palustris]